MIPFKFCPTVRLIRLSVTLEAHLHTVTAHHTDYGSLRTRAAELRLSWDWKDCTALI
ncbi:MAG: hypothetical protein BWY09_02929 [Candidatus Hydrogenedentes bacterium ADurb.Bin179]|nr:MAG: hypothetical protein BWY09_02929 [Candidatus Hydrogenedentes bacterium ADurb.Bin179]